MSKLLQLERLLNLQEATTRFSRLTMKNGNGRSGLVREERLQIMLSPQELKAVENFRFTHRMPSRAAAVRELLRHGIAAAESVAENAGFKSRDYGVLKAPKASEAER